MGSEPKFAEPLARPPGALLRTAAKLVSDPNNSETGLSSTREDKGSLWNKLCIWLASFGCILSAMKLIIKWLCSAAALLAVAYLYSGVVVTSFTSALIAAAVLGALNTVVRPVLVLLTLPVTLVTVGLFLFVINALMFWLAASLLSGLNVNGFVAALIGSLIYSVLQLAIEFVLERLLFNK